MAILRGREVQILGVEAYQDPSTFKVRYALDGETEIVKMNELEFTKEEWDQFVKTSQVEPRVVDDKRLQEVRDSQDPEKIKKQQDKTPELQDVTKMQVKAPVKK